MSNPPARTPGTPEGGDRGPSGFDGLGVRVPGERGGGPGEEE